MDTVSKLLSSHSGRVDIRFRDRDTGRFAGGYSLPLGFPMKSVTSLTDLYHYDAEIVRVVRPPIIEHAGG